MSSSTLDGQEAAVDPSPADPAAARDRTRSLAAIAAITLAGAVLWWWELGSKSLYRDEAFTASTVLRPWADLLSFSIDHEANGALHAGMLRVAAVFGESEAVLRSVSVISLVALVPIVAAIAWRLLSPRVAVLASALVVVNGSAAGYAQNARTYALSMVLAAAATLLFVLDVERPRRWTLVGWWAFGVLLAYSHIVGLLLLIAHVGSLWFVAPGRRQVGRRAWAAGLVVLASLPMAYLIATHDEGMPITGFRLGAFRDVLFTLTGRGGILGILLTAVLTLMALRVSIHVWRQGWQSAGAWAHGVILLWAFLPLVLVSVTSPVTPPLVIGRYFLFCLPALAIYMAIGLDSMLGLVERRGSSAARWQKAAVVGAVLAVSAYGVVYWYADGGEEDWRGAAHHVFEATEPGDRVLFANDSVRLFFEYYDRSEPGTDRPESAFPVGEWGTFETGDQTYESFERSVVDGVVSEPTGRVWVVIGRNHDNIENVDEVTSHLAAAYTFEGREMFRGNVEVQLWAPT